MGHPGPPDGSQIVILVLLADVLFINPRRLRQGNNKERRMLSKAG